MKIAMTVRIDDLPVNGDTPIAVNLAMDGVPIDPILVPPGMDYVVELPVEHAGPILFELEAEAGPRELSIANNRVAFSVTESGPSLTTATLASPLRVATPVVPSGDTATWLSSAAAGTRSMVLTRLTFLPSIARIETEPAMRFET